VVGGVPVQEMPGMGRGPDLELGWIWSRGLFTLFFVSLFLFFCFSFLSKLFQNNPN
jgi:hypothetical protein